MDAGEREDFFYVFLGDLWNKEGFYEKEFLIGEDYGS
jgi:hypothetical protein